MLIKPRKVKRSSKFTSRWVATSRRRKEQVASMLSMAAVQLVLATFLLLGSYRSYLAITLRNSELRLLEKAAIPAFFLLAGVYFFRAGINNIREARAVRKPPGEDEGL
jgi:cation transport ATPase